MNTDRLAPGNVVPTAVMPSETGVFAGTCERAANAWFGGDAFIGWSSLMSTPAKIASSAFLVQLMVPAVRRMAAKP